MKTVCFFSCTIIALVGLSATVSAQELDQLIDFQQHIQPIFTSQCLDCHGPKEEKGGLRVDDLDGLKSYIEPGDAEASSLWTDYLRTDDPDSLMPPPSDKHAGGLANADLLFIKTWINEGAVGQWKTADESPTESKTEVPASPASKIWSFQGLFHPAAVHLPIALLAVSSLFVFFSFFNRESCEPVAYHCLWMGALGAVAACITGWSYAVYTGYGVGVGFDVEHSAIDRHRWLGVFVAVFSILTVPLARSVRRSEDINKKIIWLFAGLILMGAVSAVGYQGGELVYGEDHYGKYFKELFPDEVATSSAVENEEREAADQAASKGAAVKDEGAKEMNAKEATESATTAPESTPATAPEPASDESNKPAETTESDASKNSEPEAKAVDPAAGSAASTPAASSEQSTPEPAK